jgi:phenylpropionate dioxygenase-like ring-hydroxylating dioxygenase large terminal subunit/AcrR family transcriptional regulator
MLNLPSETSQNPAKDARKQQLIDATIACIHQYGLEGTTISRVTKTANLSGGIVNFYFQSKDKLLLGALSAIRDEFAQKILKPAHTENTPEAVLRHIVDVHFDPIICQPDKIAVWHAFSSARRTRQEYNNICGALETELERLVNVQISRLCKQAGHNEFDPAVLARSMIGLLDSYWQDLLYNPETFEPQQARKKCLQYLSSLFPAAFKSEPAASADFYGVKANSNGNTETTRTVDMLAPWTYRSEEFFDLEIETLFKPGWMLAGHISELENPRDYVTFEGFGERALIVKGNDNVIRAFHNVCRHRGARLLEGRGKDCPQALSCPFHGWTYDLTGKLIGIPAQKTFENLDPASNGLVPLDLEIWMGFVFIRFRSEGPSLQQTLAPIEDLVAHYQIDIMKPLKGTSYRELRPYNWKVIHDIDNEGYHVPVGHPALQQLYGKQYTDEYVEDIAVSKGYINEKPGKLWSVRQYQNLLPEFDHLPKDYQRLWLYIGVFPNLVLGLYPECIEFYMTIPKSTNATWFLGCSYGLADDRREVRVARFLNNRINTITDREDDAFVRWMQEGLSSSAFPQQKLSSLEHGVKRFHQTIQQALPVGRLAQAPASGTVREVNQSLGRESCCGTPEAIHS